MSNRSPKIVAHRFLTDVRLLIDDPSITHRLLYCARKTLFFVTFFSFVILLSVLDAFFLVSEDPVDDVETQSANHKYR